MSVFVASVVFHYIIMLYYKCELCFGVQVFSKCMYKYDFIERNIYFRSPAHMPFMH